MTQSIQSLSWRYNRVWLYFVFERKRYLNTWACIMLLRFEVLTAMTMMITVLWNVMPCSLPEVYQCFRRSCSSHQQGQQNVPRWKMQQVLLKCCHIYSRLQGVTFQKTVTSISCKGHQNRNIIHYWHLCHPCILWDQRRRVGEVGCHYISISYKNRTCKCNSLSLTHTHTHTQNSCQFYSWIPLL
jgi:hypothetical protein